MIKAIFAIASAGAVLEGCSSRPIPTLSEDQAIELARQATSSAGRWLPDPTRTSHRDGWWTIVFASADVGYVTATVRVSDVDHTTQTHISSNENGR